MICGSGRLVSILPTWALRERRRDLAQGLSVKPAYKADDKNIMASLHLSVPSDSLKDYDMVADNVRSVCPSLSNQRCIALSDVY